MQAVLQNFKNGEMEIADVPPPSLKTGYVLVYNVASLVSAGTEKAVIELAKMNPLQKAIARPDLVKKVLGKAGQEGLFNTIQIIQNLVSAPLPLGYSCAGLVKGLGAQVGNFKAGDRVACAGLGYANHAEVVAVPKNLVVKIPDNVSYEDASFVTVGAIAVQGVRQAELTFGEKVVVIGLGLVGQITAQICAAAGCQVFGIDLDPSKIVLAKNLGMTDGRTPSDGNVVERVKQFTRGYGADAILITAASKSSASVKLAAELARDRARVVAVGDVGLDVPRREYYEKELDLRLSRSYGPGRYDPNFEEKGIDYPIGYVRWTENRNMESFLDLVSMGKIQLRPLITHRYDIENAKDAYALLNGEVKEPYIGILLEYNPNQEHATEVTLPTIQNVKPLQASEVAFGIIGAGQFAQGVLLPKLKGLEGVRFQNVATGSGLTAPNVAKKYNAAKCTSDYQDVLKDETVNTVLVATRHNLHGQIVADSLRAGKHVFVEKPLALNEEELMQIDTAYQSAQNKLLLVGFNRRFSPLAKKLKEALGGRQLIGTYRINAGHIAAGNWQQDAEVGGGRILGEVCHFVDLFQYLTDAHVSEVFATAMVAEEVGNSASLDNISIELRFTDGSVGHILYASVGHTNFPKERLEVFSGGSVGVIDNWCALEVMTPSGTIKEKPMMGAEKGHAQELQMFTEAIRKGQPSPIPYADLVNTTRVTFAIEESLRKHCPVTVES